MPALNWSFTQMSASFATSAVVIGLFYRMKENEIIENFLSGASDFLGVGIIIGIARGVSVILANGLIIDTVLNYSDTLISNYSSYTCLNLIYVVHLILSFFITSSSGLATITMPIMGPLATFAHIPKDLVVTAYTAASGLVNLFGPTSAVVMGSIILGKIPYTRFLKYILPRCLVFIVVTSLILSASLYISLHF